jgi:hypothetical protein
VRFEGLGLGDGARAAGARPVPASQPQTRGVWRSTAAAARMIIPAFQLHLHGEAWGRGVGTWRPPCAHPCAHRSTSARPLARAAAERVQRGHAAVGRFDAQQASLVGATHAGKVFVHSPHDAAGQQTSLLNVNKTITALATGAPAWGHALAPAGAARAWRLQPWRAEASAALGRSRGHRATPYARAAPRASLAPCPPPAAAAAGAILPNSTRDVLLIGSPNTLQCYDVDKNRRGRARARAPCNPQTLALLAPLGAGSAARPWHGARAAARRAGAWLAACCHKWWAVVQLQP